MAGRPTSYNIDIAKEICNAIASESLGTKKLCAKYPHWPAHETIFAWMRCNTEFSDMYARAKRHQVEVIVDEIIDISDDDSRDTVYGQNGPSCNKEWIARSRLRIDTRKWLAAKLVPRLYGTTVPTPESDPNKEKDADNILSVIADKLPD